MRVTSNDNLLQEGGNGKIMRIHFITKTQHPGSDKQGVISFALSFSSRNLACSYPGSIFLYVFPVQNSGMERSKKNSQDFSKLSYRFKVDRGKQYQVLINFLSKYLPSAILVFCHCFYMWKENIPLRHSHFVEVSRSRSRSHTYVSTTTEKGYTKDPTSLFPDFKS